MNDSVIVGSASDTKIADITYDKVKTKSKKYVYRITKRSFDIVLSLIGMFFLLPVAFIIKIS